MLFLVVMQFYNATTMVSKMVSIISIGMMSTVMAAIPYNLYQARNRYSGKTRFMLIVSVISLSVMVISLSVMLIPILLLTPDVFLGITYLISAIIFSISGIVGLVFVVITLPLLYLQNKAKKKENYSTYADEGSGL